MRNRGYIKGMVLAVIMLFVGLSVIPNMSSGVVEKHKKCPQQLLGYDVESENKMFLKSQFNSGKYNIASNIKKYFCNHKLTLNHRLFLKTKILSNGYDLVIIAPNNFSSELQKLVEHKNQHGIKTYLKTTEDIYNEYSGVDQSEQIKYFIKDALDNQHIKYVLLVGGLNSVIYGRPKDDCNQGARDWYVPVRYTNLCEDGNIYDPGFISDLYYADIYDSEGNFSSWDTNHNGVFAEWKDGFLIDTLDLYPDVYVGRLACRNKLEVRIMVNKIINYERYAAGSRWYKKIICAAGDSYPDPPTNYCEGEEICDYILNNYMTDPPWKQIRLYASNKDTDPQHTPTTKNIVRELGSFLLGSCGHILFVGKGNPTMWCTHYPREFETWGTIGIKNYDFWRLRNDGKLPICVVGGSHISMFNVSLLSTLKDKHNNQHMWTYGFPTPECWSWWLTRKIGGGAIATIGSTGLTYGNVENGMEHLEPFLIIQFYKAFTGNTDKSLGETWGDAITLYLDEYHPFYKPWIAPKIDAKTVEQWVLLGDPSLKIGGYKSSNELKAKINGLENGVEVDVGETVEFKVVTEDGQFPYIYEWDFNDDGIYEAAFDDTTSYCWNNPGVYIVGLRVTDSNGHIDTYDTIVGVGDWLGIDNWLKNDQQNNQCQSQQLLINCLTKRNTNTI